MHEEHFEAPQDRNSLRQQIKPICDYALATNRGNSNNADAVIKRGHAWDEE